MGLIASTPTEEAPISPDAEVQRRLHSIRALSEAVAAEVAQLSPDVWEQPTNCPPWLVGTLVAHVVISGENFVIAVRQGLAGSIEPATDPAARARDQVALGEAGPAAVSDALRAVTEAFEALYDGLPEDRLAVLCYRRRGNQPVRWYVTHRLAEVAFHAWDLQSSLGREARLDESVTTELLPTLLQTNVPRTYAAGLTAERGRGERYGLGVAGDPSARWLVRIDPDELEVRRSDGPADLEITATAENLALLVYGRRELDPASPALAYRLDGDESLVGRFAVTFPRP